MAEILDVVDENDNPVGTAPRSEVHGNPLLIHRVVHLMVTDCCGRIYLQKRADDKDVQPGKWDTSVGGHLDAGESYEQAALREGREELGLPFDADGTIAGRSLRCLYRYLHRNEYESEFVRTYSLEYEGPFLLQRSEISDGRFWSLAEIRSADRSIFTPNFLDELERFLAACKKTRG